MAALQRWDELARTCMAFLRDAVRFSMVTIAEALAVRQLEPVFAELARHGLRVQRLIVNNVVKTVDSAFLRQKAEHQVPHLEFLHERYGHLPIVEIPLLPYEVRGMDRLREVARVLGPDP
jgi:arsenite-transporting ATPase